MVGSRFAGRRAGFTLVELLTVIGIIALLIGILVPSLSRARDQARRVKVQATLSAIDKALEMFHNDFGEYPDSGGSIDPIEDLNAKGRIFPMEGVHWLARALVGHDFQGVDTAGRSLDSYAYPVSMAELADAARRGPYLADATIVRDTDARFGDTTGDSLRNGRPIVIDDAYESPILYYRASPKAPEPFCQFGDPINGCAHCPKRPGIYELSDNQRITGRWENGSSVGPPDSLPGWDFANTGQLPHPIASFGSVHPDSVSEPPSYNPAGKTFTGLLHDEDTLKAAGVVRPHNPDRFILIDAGRDGLYGTEDDLTNF